MSTLQIQNKAGAMQTEILSVRATWPRRILSSIVSKIRILWKRQSLKRTKPKKTIGLLYP